MPPPSKSCLRDFKLRCAQGPAKQGRLRVLPFSKLQSVQGPAEKEALGLSGMLATIHKCVFIFCE